ncbi:hypothetical protein N431DRAFT_30252 [Stipitochalara longipes BDJ]|nr:hypothetical protein N431DRAFT_30252 [Stipitochalara longipes BDJ]
MSLPTYEDTVKGPNKLIFVAPYLGRASLLAASVVCKEWHSIFTVELWSDPIRLTAQTRTPFAKTHLFFMRSSTLSETRRKSVLALDFRPLKLLERRFLQDHAKYSQVTTPKYIMRFIPFFENVRFLVMDNMGRNDYEIQQLGETRQPDENNKLLLLSSTNIPLLDYNLFVSTPILYNIMYMDLSYTVNTQAWNSLLSYHSLDNLRILKLRGLRLTDQSLPFDTLHNSLRLWSLDLRNNSLTDQTIDFLLRECFAPTLTPNSTVTVDSDEWFYEDPPTYHQRDETDLYYPSHNTEIPVRPDTIDSFILYMKRYANLRNPSSVILAERDPMKQSTGLTHLYLSSNRFTSKGIHKLLSSTNRLQVLDVGTVKANPHSDYHLANTTPFAQPNAASLLDRRTGTRIEDLRIHHSFATCIPTIVQGRLEMGYTPQYLHKAEKFGDLELQSAAFSPLINYRLSSVTLTDIPLKSTGPTITRLITFLRCCARQEAILLSATTSGPRKTRHSPRLLPGLRKLRLEFLHERSGSEDIGPSVSGDQDADEFQAQSQGDFSFFADEKMTSPVGSSRRGSTWSSKSSIAELVETRDVCEELKIFRQGETPKWGGKLELAVPGRR